MADLFTTANQAAALSAATAPVNDVTTVLDSSLPAAPEQGSADGLNVATAQFISMMLVLREQPGKRRAWASITSYDGASGIDVTIDGTTESILSGAHTTEQEALEAIYDEVSANGTLNVIVSVDAVDVDDEVVAADSGDVAAIRFTSLTYGTDFSFGVAPSGGTMTTLGQAEAINAYGRLWLKTGGEAATDPGLWVAPRLVQATDHFGALETDIDVRHQGRAYVEWLALGKHASDAGTTVARMKQVMCAMRTSEL